MHSNPHSFLLVEENVVIVLKKCVLGVLFTFLTLAFFCSNVDISVVRF